jgi:hypothetical protein
MLLWLLPYVCEHTAWEDRPTHSAAAQRQAAVESEVVCSAFGVWLYPCYSSGWCIGVLVSLLPCVLSVGAVSLQ